MGILDGYDIVPTSRTAHKLRKEKAYERWLHARDNGNVNYSNDYQQQRVYDAESKWRNRYKDSDESHIFYEQLSIEELQDKTDEILSLPEIVEMFGEQDKVVCLPGKGGNHPWCRPTYRDMTFPTGTRSIWFLIHELSHILTPIFGEGHGPKYVDTYLKMVRFYFGEEHCIIFFNCLMDYGVDYR